MSCGISKSNIVSQWDDIPEAPTTVHKYMKYNYNLIAF